MMNPQNVFNAAGTVPVGGRSHPSRQHQSWQSRRRGDHGSVAMDIPVEMIRRMGALTDYLALNTKLNVSFRPSPNLESTVMIGTGKTQIAYSHGAYIEHAKNTGSFHWLRRRRRTPLFFTGDRRENRKSGIHTPAELKVSALPTAMKRPLLQKARSVDGIEIERFLEICLLKHYDILPRRCWRETLTAASSRILLPMTSRARALP